MTPPLCSYCATETAPDEVSRAHAFTVLCRACAATTHSLADLRRAWTAVPTAHTQDPDWLRARAADFLSGRPPTDEAAATAFAKFTALRAGSPADWMPLRRLGRVHLAWGAPPTWTPSGDFDGRHRFALADALGVAALPVVDGFAGLHPCAIPRGHYQTVAWPARLVLGWRPADRFALWPSSLVGQRIVELGCAEGQDGIWAVALGAAHYFGVDRRVEVATAFARAWGVADRCTFVGLDLLREWPLIPQAEVLWVLSSVLQLGRACHERALRESGAHTVYVETHRALDDPADADTRALLAAWPFGWRLLGVSRYGGVGGGGAVRHLYAGTVPSGWRA